MHSESDDFYMVTAVVECSSFVFLKYHYKAYKCCMCDVDDLHIQIYYVQQNMINHCTMLQLCYNVSFKCFYKHIVVSGMFSNSPSQQYDLLFRLCDGIDYSRSQYN